MCQHGETKEVIIDGKSISIDSCIAEKIEAINLVDGFRTMGSCCGHGIYRPTIIIERSGVIYEYYSRTLIPRKRNFYRKDSNGIYYLPEVRTIRKAESDIGGD